MPRPNLRCRRLQRVEVTMAGPSYTVSTRLMNIHILLDVIFDTSWQYSLLAFGYAVLLRQSELRSFLR